MTTQQKTTAIKNILANHQDNVDAVQAAEVDPGLSALVIAAMNNAFEADLEAIFRLQSARKR